MPFSAQQLYVKTFFIKLDAALAFKKRTKKYFYTVSKRNSTQEKYIFFLPLLYCPLHTSLLLDPQTNFFLPPPPPLVVKISGDLDATTFPFYNTEFVFFPDGTLARLKEVPLVDNNRSCDQDNRPNSKKNPASEEPLTEINYPIKKSLDLLILSDTMAAFISRYREILKVIKND